MGQANYSAAKAGLLGFTKAVAQEGAARGITCNVIAPGYIATEMVQAVPKEVLETKILPLIPVGRLGTRRGDRALRGVPCRRRRRLHHRRLPRRQRRAIHGVARHPGQSRCRRIASPASDTCQPRSRVRTMRGNSSPCA